MPFCQTCGSPVQPEARFCAACGNPANISSSSNPPNLVATASAAVALPPATYSAPPNVGLSRTPVQVAPGAQIREEAIRAHRPPGVTILAVLSFLGMVPTVPLGVVLLGYAVSASAEGSIPLMRLLMQLFPVIAKGQQDMVTQAFEASAGMFAIAAICAVLGYGLWRLRKWGRILAIASSVLLSLHAVTMILTSSGTLLWHLFAIAINIWIFTYLLKPHVKQAFCS
jgi:hypothetical protein